MEEVGQVEVVVVEEEVQVELEVGRVAVRVEQEEEAVELVVEEMEVLENVEVIAIVQVMPHIARSGVTVEQKLDTPTVVMDHQQIQMLENVMSRQIVRNGHHIVLNMAFVKKLQSLVQMDQQDKSSIISKLNMKYINKIQCQYNVCGNK